MEFLPYIIAYMVGFVGFCLYDAVIGFGDVDFNGMSYPPLILAAIAWPISVPMLLMYGFICLCDKLKKSRVNRQEKKRKIRIAIQREQEVAMKEAEAEVERVMIESRRRL